MYLITILSYSFIYLRQGSLCSPGQPGAHYRKFWLASQHGNRFASASQGALATTPGSQTAILIQLISFMIWCTLCWVHQKNYPEDRFYQMSKRAQASKRWQSPALGSQMLRSPSLQQPNQLHITCRQNGWLIGRQNEAFESKQAETTSKRQEMMRTRFLISWRPVFCTSGSRRLSLYVHMQTPVCLT